VRLRRITAIVGVFALVLVVLALSVQPAARVYRHFFSNPPPVPRHAYTTLRHPRGTRPARLSVEPFSLHSSLLARSLEQVLVLPAGKSAGRPLLVLLHGRGSSPSAFLNSAWLNGLAALGQKAPIVLLVNGGESSYYHDRSGGRWGSYVIKEVIPAALRRTAADRRRIAIGGISMGGFGSFRFALTQRGKFCAVGGHSAALWRTSAETALGAFDDAADFARNDVIDMAGSRSQPLGKMRVWIDVGNWDPFFSSDSELARVLREHGQKVTFHVWPGSHSGAYWNKHVGQYLRFYADALAAC
jgi:S-formylglutathione hydrolase FrmB